MTYIMTHPVTDVKPGDVMHHKVLNRCVDVSAVAGLWVEFFDRADYKAGPHYLELSVFLEAYEWVRNSPVLLSCWDNMSALRDAQRRKGILVPTEFDA